MKIFKLPDLGEGLPEATIREWHVKVGDTVTTDQPLVSVETAKALMEVPAPFDGTVEKLFGQTDDVITTGAALIGFIGKDDSIAAEDSATVAGKIVSSDQVIQTQSTPVNHSIKATPAVRALARKLGVNLSEITPQGPRITQAEVEQHAQSTPETTTTDALQPLAPVRQAMVKSMQASRQHIVPATIMDEANISNWQPKQKITLRLIRAVIAACLQEPMLNNSLATNGTQFRHNPNINLGIAVDTKEGLFVPVIHQVETLSDEEILNNIATFKQQAETKEFPADIFKNPTITLSNFGTFAGRFAMPIIVPPQAAIIAAGRITETNSQKLLPLSVTFDHRFITGGEAARFLKILLDQLQE